MFLFFIVDRATFFLLSSVHYWDFLYLSFIVSHLNTQNPTSETFSSLISLKICPDSLPNTFYWVLILNYIAVHQYLEVTHFFESEFSRNTILVYGLVPATLSDYYSLYNLYFYLSSLCITYAILFNLSACLSVEQSKNSETLSWLQRN